MRFLNAPGVVMYLVFVGLISCLNVQATPSYIDAPPLSEAISQRAGTVERSDTVVLPLITWGADIATIHANGDDLVTQPGSLFAQAGLKFRLQRQDDFKKQVSDFIAGKSPYLRGTAGMIQMAAEVLAKDPRTKPVVIYQLSWSAGGDALVVNAGIKRAVDLKGKRIAIQAYGPHVAYLNKILSDAGLGLGDVSIKWMADLTATENSPMAAMQAGDVDAALVVIPDALALTSGGNVGSGAEDSVKGAKILLSTRTANRIIADVYAVRADYLQANRAQVEQFVNTMMVAAESVQELAGKPESPEFRRTIGASAKILLDSAQAIADTEGLFADAQLVGFKGNVEFFASATYPRRLSKLASELRPGLKSAGLLLSAVGLDSVTWDYAALKRGLQNTDQVEVPAFKSDEVATVIERKQQQGTLDEGTLFQFEVFFRPNQNQFSQDLYEQSFARVIELASTYGGAIITVEGHSDPMGYLRKKKSGESEIVLGRIKQSAKNLSLSRAISVRNSVMALASKQGIGVDPSQFAVVGHGINRPATGICGADPCAPKSEEQWLSNMRVEFRIIQVEAESSVFQPL